ncbi:MAG: LacI family DNA-binding transcriptional regulator, partial [Candidatus Omnitrophica bacterium]|nr:LacI family DNA-binding transcriptional regulator [Candidatus Omnitrophota bacterium]
MVSIVDVAREAGVSQATVSRVLGGKVRVNVETRDRVLNAVASLGYRPNAIGKALRAGQSKIVALLISDIAQGWYAALAKELQLAFEA